LAFNSPSNINTMFDDNRELQEKDIVCGL
jgi:hypothetical protein